MNINYKDIANILWTGISTFFVYVFGGIDVAFKCLIIIMTIDYISGVIANRINLDSKIGFKGIAKKVMILALVAVGAQVDKATGTDGYICRTLVTMFYIANESLSIVENSAKMGLPVPQKLIDCLEQLKGNEESEDKKNESK